jgi:hypothetical protein
MATATLPPGSLQRMVRPRCHFRLPLSSGDELSARKVKDVTPACCIALTVSTRLLIGVEREADTETVPLLKWLTAVKTASRTFVLRSGIGPSRVVPAESSWIRLDRCERERITAKTLTPRAMHIQIPQPILLLHRFREVQHSWRVQRPNGGAQAARGKRVRCGTGGESRACLQRPCSAPVQN